MPYDPFADKVNNPKLGVPQNVPQIGAPQMMPTTPAPYSTPTAGVKPSVDPNAASGPSWLEMIGDVLLDIFTPNKEPADYGLSKPWDAVGQGDVGPGGLPPLTQPTPSLNRGVTTAPSELPPLPFPGDEFKSVMADELLKDSTPRSVDVQTVKTIDIPGPDAPPLPDRKPSISSDATAKGPVSKKKPEEGTGPTSVQKKALSKPAKTPAVKKSNKTKASRKDQMMDEYIKQEGFGNKYREKAANVKSSSDKFDFGSAINRGFGR